MPLYLYKCDFCGKEEPRIAGVDDHHATCAVCHNVMRRIIDTDDLYKPYWYECLYSSDSVSNTKKNTFRRDLFHVD